MTSPLKITLHTQTIDYCDYQGSPGAENPNWSGDATLEADPENGYIEGNAAISIDTDIETNGMTYNFDAPRDLSNSHIVWWTLVIGGTTRLETLANGGMQVRISDGANTGTWYVGGKDTYPGGWQLMVLDPNRPVDSGTAPNLAAATSVAFYFTCTAKNKASGNCLVDWVRNTLDLEGSSYTITGGTDQVGNWEDVFTEDDTTKVGFIIKRGGMYILNGPMNFGDDVGTSSLYFHDTGSILSFEDQQCAEDFYKINIVGNATGTTKVEFGQLTRSSGKNLTTEGNVFNVNRPPANSPFRFGFSSGTQRTDSTLEYTVHVEDNNVDEVSFFGCSFRKAGEIYFGNPTTPFTKNLNVINTSFESCGSVIINVVDTTNLENITVAKCRNRFIPFDATAQGGLKIFHLFSKPQFPNVPGLLRPQLISNRRGIEFRDQGDFIIEGASFANNNTDLYFSQVQDSRAVVNLINSDENPTFNEDNGRIWIVREKTSYNLNVKDVDASNLGSVGVRLSATNTGRSRGQESFITYTKGGDTETPNAGSIPEQYVIRRTHDTVWDTLGSPTLDSTNHYPFELRVRKYGYIPQKITGKTFSSTGISDSLVLQTDDYTYRTNETVVADTTGIIIFNPPGPLDSTLFISPHVGKREGGSTGPWQEPPANGEYMRIGLQEVYEWCRWYTAQIENMKLEDVFNTSDGVTYNNDYYTVRIDGTAMNLVGSNLNLYMPNKYFRITGNPYPEGG